MKLLDASSGQKPAKKSCHHDGSSPVLIGGYPIRLAACPHITAEALAKAQVLFPLNGQMPYKPVAFGKAHLVFQCELMDRGGVPANWADFIRLVAEEYMPKGYDMMAWCFGSHGRTGCFGASLISVMMPEVEDPIAYVRQLHCQEAVESLAQAKAIFALRDQPLPAKYEEEFKPLPLAAYDGYYSDPAGWYEGKLYWHDVGLCPCPACSVDRAADTRAYQVRRPTPCLCAKYTNCEKDRAEYNNREIRPAIVSSSSAPVSCLGDANGIECFCPRHMGQDIEDAAHREPACTCRCRECIVKFKLEVRGDLEWLHSLTHHPSDCFCDECWYSCKGHKEPCFCNECISLNVQPEELETEDIDRK